MNTMKPRNIVTKNHHEDFHISFDTASYFDYGSITTAIVAKDTLFLVMNGDHRRALDGLTFAQAVEFYDAHPEWHNFRSERKHVPAGTPVTVDAFAEASGTFWKQLLAKDFK